MSCRRSQRPKEPHSGPVVWSSQTWPKRSTPEADSSNHPSEFTETARLTEGRIVSRRDGWTRTTEYRTFTVSSSWRRRSHTVRFCTSVSWDFSDNLTVSLLSPCLVCKVFLFSNLKTSCHYYYCSLHWSPPGGADPPSEYWNTPEFLPTKKKVLNRNSCGGDILLIRDKEAE